MINLALIIIVIIFAITALHFLLSGLKNYIYFWSMTITITIFLKNESHQQLQIINPSRTGPYFPFCRRGQFHIVIGRPCSAGTDIF